MDLQKTIQKKAPVQPIGRMAQQKESEKPHFHTTTAALVINRPPSGQAAPMAMPASRQRQAGGIQGNQPIQGNSGGQFVVPRGQGGQRAPRVQSAGNQISPRAALGNRNTGSFLVDQFADEAPLSSRAHAKTGAQPFAPAVAASSLSVFSDSYLTGSF